MYSTSNINDIVCNINNVHYVTLMNTKQKRPLDITLRYGTLLLCLTKLSRPVSSEVLHIKATHQTLC